MSTTTDDMKQFSVETQWKIKDLTSETGKKFNGKTCVIVSIFDVTTCRVGVRIKNPRNRGRTLNIKPINLHDDQSTTLMEGQEEGLKERQEEGLKETQKHEAKDVENKGFFVKLDTRVFVYSLFSLSTSNQQPTCTGDKYENLLFACLRYYR